MSDQRVKPFKVDADKPVFEEPWQAQVLAMADLLIQNQQISSVEWSEVLGKQLKIEQGVADTQENYYKAALTSLTQLIDSTRMISKAQLSHRENQWKDAYLSTPHGKPVELK